MERFVIEGGHRLSGTIRPAGNKNAALPLLAATLLTSEPVILRNMPEIGDVVVGAGQHRKAPVAAQPGMFGAARLSLIRGTGTRSLAFTCGTGQGRSTARTTCSANSGSGGICRLRTSES